ncbi:MAG: hypothetical protein IKW20_05285 [Bacteroidales bacterium]|nr:hypothetical protein [Bacteroidales bacterium]
MKPRPESRIRIASTIKCCHHCVAPKRYPGCHDHCPEYLKEKAEYEALKAAYNGNAYVNAGLYDQREKRVMRAMKGKWKK